MPLHGKSIAGRRKRKLRLRGLCLIKRDMLIQNEYILYYIMYARKRHLHVNMYADDTSILVLFVVFTFVKKG